MTIIKNIISILDKETGQKKFLQIGANDGIIFDHLREFIVKDEWQGILIEPVKETFEELVENHKKSKNLKFINIAISDVQEEKEISYIPKEAIKKNNLNISLKGCSTFHEFRQGEKSIPMRVHEEKNKNFLTKQMVKCETLNNVLLKEKIKELDLLQIDTEGHEHKIITSIDFKDFYCKVIIFETNRRKKMFSNEQIEEMFRHLNNNEYHIFEIDQDSIAVHNSVIDKFTSQRQR